MKRIILIFVLGIMSLGCAQDVFHSEELIPYSLEFFNDAKVRGVPLYAGFNDISVIFGHPQRGNGHCLIKNHFFYKTREVVIDYESWSQADNLTQKYFIYHELAHCAMGLLHNDDIHEEKGIPASIMNYVLPSRQELGDNEEYYLNELFFGSRINYHRSISSDFKIENVEE